MSAIDRAKAHFKSLQIKAIEVPEWGDENGPLIVYVEPFTLKGLEPPFLARLP